MQITTSDADTLPPLTWADVRERIDQVDRYRAAVAAIALAQAVWFGVLMGQGWYYQADFSNLAAASGKGFSWSYLLSPQGGHFAPFSRGVLWLLNRTIPLDHTATIVLRVLLMAAATVLLGRLLTMLVGRRTGTLVVLALYAFSPLLIQSSLWLTPSILALPAQICTILMITNHVRYARSGQLRHAVATAGFLLAAQFMSDSAGFAAITLPFVSMIALTTGGVGRRARATLACWREWVMLAVVPVAFVLVLALNSHKYAAVAHRLSFGETLKLSGTFLANSIVPSATGTLWGWSTAGDNYLALATPSIWSIAAGFLVLALCLLAGVRRVGVGRAVAAAVMPAAVAAVTIIAVGVGRFSVYGLLSGRITEYAFNSAVPTALGTALLLWPAVGQPDHMPPPSAEGTNHRREHPWARFRPAGVVGILGVLVLAGSLVTAVTYTVHWRLSPAKRYVSTLTASLRAHGPKVSLFDTPVAAKVLPFPAEPRSVSALLSLTDAKVSYNRSNSLMVGADGHLVKAAFIQSKSVNIPTGNRFCNDVIRGAGTFDQYLSSPGRANAWFVYFSYFQGGPSVIDVQIIDTDHRVVDPVRGRQVVLTARLDRVYVQFPTTTPLAIRVHSSNPRTSLCLTQVAIGYPLARK